MPFGADNIGELLVWAFLLAIVVFGVKGSKGGGNNNSSGGGSSTPPPQA